MPGIVYAAVPEGYLGENLFSRSFYAEVLGSHSALGSTSNFLRLHVQGERAIDFRPGWHLLLRGEVGFSAVSHFEQLPGIYRFYAGGDRSVRGFAFDALSPRVQATKGPYLGQWVNVGAKNLLTGTLEIERDLPRSFGVAIFYDSGNAIDRIDQALAASVGVGLRWRLSAVTLGFDIAKAIKYPGADEYPGAPTMPGPRLHLNISPKL